MSDLDEIVEVRLLRLPLDVHHRAQQHSDELTREFQLMVDSSRTSPTSTPARLVELSATLSAQYAGATDAQDAAIDEARGRGDAEIAELVFTVPRHAAEACLALGALLDEADEYCRAGQHLLTLATPPDLVAFRRWYLDEFVAQIGGSAPTAWGPTAVTGLDLSEA